MNELLKELAEKLGISTSFTYGCGTIKTSVVGDDVLRFFIESLGYGAKNDEEIRKSLERLEKRRWQKAAESVYVMTVDEQGFDLVLSEDEAKGENRGVVCAGRERRFQLSGSEFFRTGTARGRAYGVCPAGGGVAGQAGAGILRR